MGCWQENRRQRARKRDPADQGMLDVLTIQKNHTLR